MAIHQIQTGGHSVGAGGDCKMFCQCWFLSYMACVVLRITLDCELDFFLLKYLTHCAFSILNIFTFSCVAQALPFCPCLYVVQGLVVYS